MKTLFAVLCVGLLLGNLSYGEDKKGVASAEKSGAVTKNVTPDEAEQLLKSRKGVVVLDVRTPEEFQEGHIAGAKNLDFHGDDFASKLGELDKSKTYLLHCAAGGRSGKTFETMKAKGFSSVYHMNGGFSAWKQAGKPVEK